eukprot:COSAG06_NODE_1376_length_9648_cov_67.818096_3_plen_356_part_00
MVIDEEGMSGKLADFGMMTYSASETAAAETTADAAADNYGSANKVQPQQHPSGDDDAIAPYGTWEYMSPECFKRKYGEPDFKSDVFSLGVMMWEMLARARPYTAFPGFEDDDEAPRTYDDDGKLVVDVKIIAHRLADGQRPAPSAGCPEVLHMLMQACWVHKMDERPPAQALLDVIKRIRAAKDVLDPPPVPESELEQPAVVTYDSFVAKLGLQDKTSLLAEYLSCPGSELLELKQMDEADLREDILEDADLGLTPEQQGEFCAAVEELHHQPQKTGVDADSPSTGNTLVDLSSEGAWVALTARLGSATRDDEVSALRQERDAALEERDDALERDKASLAELAELRSRLEGPSPS